MWRFLIISIVLFSLLSTGYELSRASDLRPERRFELVHNFPTDYNFYLSRIREGIEGRWTAVEKYTAEPHRGSFIHEMYVLMGRVGGFVRVPWGRSGDVYHVARVVLAVALLAMIAEFTKKNFLAFLLAVTASSWPKLVIVEGFPRFGGYMPWWSVMDSLQRITFIPHILVGQILMLFLIMELTGKKPIQKNILFLGILGFLLGMIFPPGLIFVFGVIGVYSVLFKFHKSYFAFILVSCSSLLYLYLMTSFYPWKRLAEVDVIRPLSFNYIEYFKAVGPIGVIGVIGGIWVLWKKENTLYPAVAWVIAWLGLLGVFRFIPSQSPLRFSEMIPHVPLAILAVGYLGRLRHLRFLVVFLIVLGFFQMWSSWLWQKDFVDHKIRASTPLVPYDSYVMYPLKDFMGGISYIQDHYPRRAVILSEFTASNYIPVYSGNTVYAGHDNTVQLEEKRKIVKQFFGGKMTNAREFLTKNAIAAVFYGPQEKEWSGLGDLSKTYPFLHEVFKNTYVKIYEVR